MPRINSGQDANLVPRPRPTTVHTAVTVSFKYYQPGGDFCLSICTRDEVRAAIDCLRLLTTMTWMQVFQSGGRGGNKAGLGYTTYDDHALRGVTRPPTVSAEVFIGAIRASQKFRIFGCCIEHVFYVLWFDREHKIVPV